MASRKMTFTLAGAKLREREKPLIRACEIANGDPEALAIEHEWEVLSDSIDAVAEPWNDAPAR